MAEDKDGKGKKPGLFDELKGLGEAVVKKAKETPIVGDVVKKVEDSEMAKGALKGAAAGTFIPGIGWVYGAAIGAALQTETGKQAYEAGKQVFEAGKKQVQDALNEANKDETPEAGDDTEETPKKQDRKGPKGPNQG